LKINRNLEITVELQGGLGNQLFGWATGYNLAQKNNAVLKLNTSALIARKFELDKFQITKDIQIVNYKLRNHRFNWIQNRIHAESGFAFDPGVMNVKCPVTLRGYFQSWRYFEEVSSSIRSSIRMDETTSDYDKLSKMFEEGKYLCIHVRRGDYLQAQEHHGLTSKEYFHRAIEIATSVADINQIAVFSDDIESAKKLINSADLYISEKELPSSAETLLLMSKNEALIGSNSSFSWWAAYIGDSESRLRIFPRPWFAESKLDTRDLLPQNWLTIGL
jgi:hypothetical protein